VAGILIVLFGGLYLTIEPSLYARGVARLVPPRNRERVAEALLASGRALRRWMAGTAVNMVIVGALTTVGLLALGIPAALALGLIAGLLEFVPIFGPVIAAVPALAVALIISPVHALWVLLLFLAIQQLESNVITPLVMKGAVRLPPALTMMFQVLMAVLFGFLGLLLAVPLLAATVVLTRRLYVEPLEAAPAAPPGAAAAALSPGSRPRG
jgi:predicted PurR-regulated permease PerM